MVEVSRHGMVDRRHPFLQNLTLRNGAPVINSVITSIALSAAPDGPNPVSIAVFAPLHQMPPPAHCLRADQNMSSSCIQLWRKSDLLPGMRIYIDLSVEIFSEVELCILRICNVKMRGVNP